MKLSYSNPIVTYDEVVAAARSIVECAIKGNNTDEDYLKAKYDAGTNNKLDSAAEELLMSSLRSLAQSVESSSRIIRGNLERELRALDDSVLKLGAEYIIGQEKRKLACEEVFVQKLRDASLPLERIYQSKKDEDLDDGLEDTMTINFDDFFNEDVKEEQDDNVDEIIDIEDLYNTIELEPGADDYIIPEELGPAINDSEEISDESEKENTRIALIKKAISKAEQQNDTKLVAMLEERLAKELEVEK